jgi:glycosyltransferase involved in cell wall biosynthesis
MNGNNINTPMVSIIMNCFNGEKYLKEAIESVLKQTYTNWELIFWDNQSTDNSASIFKSYNDLRFKYFFAERHTKLGEGRNLAIAQSTGDWIAFLDCDDLWVDSKLEKQINNIGKLFENL